MLKNLCLILGFAGSVLSLGETIIFTVIFTFAAFDGFSNSTLNFFINNGRYIGIILMFFLVCGLVGSLNVRKHPVTSGAAMTVSGALTFIFLSLLLPDTLWPGKLPPLLLIFAGALALICRRNIPAAKEPRVEDPGLSGQ